MATSMLPVAATFTVTDSLPMLLKLMLSGAPGFVAMLAVAGVLL